jgi:prophage regulatory protein
MAQESLKMLKRIAVEKKCGVSRSWIYAELSKPESEFPKPVRLTGGNSIGWYEHEIDQYLATRQRVEYRAKVAA